MKPLHLFKLDRYTPARSLFVILAAVLLWKIGANLVANQTMRGLEVKVVSSKLAIKHTIERGAPPCEYTLHLVLETTGTSPRRIVEELDIAKAWYPEEAYDELAFWAPGTLHKVHLIRGDATEVRLSTTEDNPELAGAAVLLFPAVFCILGVVAFVGASGKLGDNAFLIVPFMVGIPMLLGAVLLVGRGVWKDYTWPQVEAKVTESGKTWDPASVPPGTTVGLTASDVLKKIGTYSVAEYQFGGRTFHFGVRGVEPVGTTYRFLLNPSDRFERLYDPYDFEALLVTLLFMGFGFTGIGLLVRHIVLKGPTYASENR